MLVVISALIIACAFAGRAGAQPKQAVRENIIEVDPKVVISLCLKSGTVTIDGWDRNEVGMRPANGVQLSPQDRSNDSTARHSLQLLNLKTGGKCIESADIELNIPRQARIDLQSGSARVKVSRIATLKISNQDGAIEVEQASQLIEINSIASHILIRDSRGSIKLHSSSGSIQVQHVRRNEVGEICEATSLGGDITFEGVDYTIVEASTMNGVLSFIGPLVWAGRYNFQTMLGDIKLSLPPDSSFRIGATVPQGTHIRSDFTLQMTSPPVGTSAKVLGKSAPNMQYVYAAAGSADIFLKLATFSGHIYLQKQ